MSKASPPGGPPFGPPGKEFPTLPLDLKTVSGDWLRLHHSSRGPVFFSKAAASRWDHDKGIGALCLGRTLAGVVLERFGNQLRANGKFLTDDEASDFTVTTVRLSFSEKVADIRGPRLFQLNADAQIFTGSYVISREWSLAFMHHPAQPGGILYPSRHDPTKTNLVLFDRGGVKAGISNLSSSRLRDHPQFTRMQMQLRIAVLPPRHVAKAWGP